MGIFRSQGRHDVMRGTGNLVLRTARRQWSYPFSTWCMQQSTLLAIPFCPLQWDPSLFLQQDPNDTTHYTSPPNGTLHAYYSNMSFLADHLPGVRVLEQPVCSSDMAVCSVHIPPGRCRPLYSTTAGSHPDTQGGWVQLPEQGNCSQWWHHQYRVPL